MSKKISKRVRDEAIEMLLLDADLIDRDGYMDDEDSCAFVDCARTNDPARNLAVDAFIAVPYMFDTIGTDALEAAYLLMDGWNPGDEVVRIGGAP